MPTDPVRVRDKDSLAQFLGWFSLALGTAQVAAPRLLCRVVGAHDEGAAPRVMRLMGTREVTQGIGILTRPRPTTWLWSRVAGDALDLSLLGVTAARNGGRRGRTVFAIANVLGVTVPDVFESLHLSRKTGEPQASMLVRKAVTIDRTRDEVETAWVQSDELRKKIAKSGGAVTFTNAPADRGTEVAVEFLQRPFAGDLGAAAAKLIGKDLATELSDDLRRFKQRVETGEVVRSDSTPTGHLLATHVKQRPAQPLEEAVR
ncbi:MAG: hypothetical protein ACJ747_04225 [Gaiellaceae bacterium]